MNQGEVASRWYANGKSVLVLYNLLMAGHSGTPWTLGFLATGYQVDGGIAFSSVSRGGRKSNRTSKRTEPL